MSETKRFAAPAGAVPPRAGLLGEVLRQRPRGAGEVRFTGTDRVQDAKRFLESRKGAVATGAPVMPRA
jgi:hypothetical protein